MGKVEIVIYFCVTADSLTKVLLKCFWNSPLPTIGILSKSLILIGGHGNRKAKFSKKKIKNLLLRSHIAFIADIQASVVADGPLVTLWDVQRISVIRS